MSADLPAIPTQDHIPADELAGAEASLTVLQQVLHRITTDDLAIQTPCHDFDVAALTTHLLNSIKVIGGAAGGIVPEPDTAASVEQQILAAARPALDAWHRRGLDGTVPFGDGEAPATLMAGILPLEFLVHAWDYATAVGQQVDAPDALAEYVLQVAQRTISPGARSQVGFDEAVSVSGDAPALDRLIGFTGREPSRC